MQLKSLRILLIASVIIFSGCTTTAITSKEGILTNNIFYNSKKQEGYSTVVFTRDRGFMGSAMTAYLYLKDSNYEQIPIANLDQGEKVEIYIPAGEYIFKVEINPLAGQVQFETSQKIEENKIYYYRVVPMMGTGFQIQRVAN
jgi:hypothetical protein